MIVLSHFSNFLSEYNTQECNIWSFYLKSTHKNSRIWTRKIIYKFETGACKQNMYCVLYMFNDFSKYETQTWSKVKEWYAHMSIIWNWKKWNSLRSFHQLMIFSFFFSKYIHNWQMKFLTIRDMYSTFHIIFHLCSFFL